MQDTDALIDAIYEAAFVPALWPSVLDEIASASGCACGALHVADANHGDPLGWKASTLIADCLDRFNRDGLWREGEKPFRFLAKGHTGFLCDIDFLTPDEMARDPFNRMLKPMGLWWQTGSIITMPTGEHAAFTFERWQQDGPPNPQQIALLDNLRPHLARAGLVAARLRLERAQAALAGLDALNLAAAVLTAAGKVLCANRAFETDCGAIITRAQGRMALGDTAAQVLFQTALANWSGGPKFAVRSIPLRNGEDRPPAVLHLLPLVREAHAAFFGADLLMMITPMRPDTPIPSLRLLHALFDLTAAECRLANALAAGQALRDAAEQSGIAFSTARSYLEIIFHKTGTHHQHELVALLKSVPPIDLDGTP